MEIILAGTGTSHGIPVVGCECAVCVSTDNRDKRDRTSAFVYGSDGTTIIIDVTPEFRHQALRYKLSKAQAVLLTHAHADHVHGLDDLRIFSHTWNPKKVKKDFVPKEALKIFANQETLNDIKKRFDYVFTPTYEGGGKPYLELDCTDVFTETNPLCIGCLEIIPIPLKHGCLTATGWKFFDKNTQGSFAYITDCNFISDASVSLIEGVTHCVIDSLREEKHSTHFCFQESLEYSKRIGAEKTWFTHISHDFSHVQIQEWIDGHLLEQKSSIAPAYDGLILQC